MGPSHVRTPRFGLIQFSETWQYFYWSNCCYCTDWFCTVIIRSLPALTGSFTALNGLIGSSTDLISLTDFVTALTGSGTDMTGLIGSGTDPITLTDSVADLTDSTTAFVVLILLCLVWLVVVQL